MQAMKTTGRRGFLLAAGFGTAAAVAVARPGIREQHTAPAAEPQQHEGYRATEHIQKYYKTTEV